MKNISELTAQLSTLSAIKPASLSDSESIDHIMIDGSPQKQDYCQLLCDLAIDFQQYLQAFFIDYKNNSLSREAVDELFEFIKNLIQYFEETYFLRGQKSEAWVDAVYLFFGTTLYYRGLIRLVDKTVELFYLQESLLKLEKIVYNNCYYELTSFQH